jgi:hypothetical protein
MATEYDRIEHLEYQEFLLDKKIIKVEYDAYWITLTLYFDDGTCAEICPSYAQDISIHL